MAVQAWGRGSDGRDPRIQASFAAPIGFVAMLAAAAVLSALRAHLSLDVGLVVMAGLVALSGWLFAWGAVLATAGIAWLLLNGFVVDQSGVLHWHGISDVVRLVALYGCGLTGALLRSAWLTRRRRRAGRRAGGVRHA